CRRSAGRRSPRGGEPSESSRFQVPGSKFNTQARGRSDVERGTWNLELPAGEPAINDERRPGNVTAGVARQVHGRGAEFVRLAEPASPPLSSGCKPARSSYLGRITAASGRAGSPPSAHRGGDRRRC